MGILLIFFLYRKKMLFYLSVFFSSIICGIFAFPIMKVLIGKSFQNFNPVLNDFGYPSGYAMISMIFFLLIRYVFQPLMKKKRVRYGTLALAGILILGTGMAILQVHVHKTTDLMGGLLLGIFILTINIIIRKVIFQSHKDKKKEISLNSKRRILNLLME